MPKKSQQKADLEIGFESITDPNEVAATDNNVDIDSLFMENYFDEVDGGFIDSNKADNNANVVKDGSDGSDKPDGDELAKQVASLRMELDSIKDRYVASSTEGQQLAQRNRELEAYSPLIDRMRDDPGLVKTVKSYLGIDDSPSIIPKMDIPEDFVFDMDEALKDRNSQSALMLSKIISAAVGQEVGGLKKDLSMREAERSRANAESEQRRVLMDEFKISEKEVDELIEWSKNQRLTLKDIYFLKNREARDKDILTKTSKDLLSHVQRVGQMPRSLAGIEETGKTDGAKDELDKLFSAIENATGSKRFG